MTSVLLLFRQYHNLLQQYVADRLAISVEKYENLEYGIEKLNKEFVSKLSTLYKVPPQIFSLECSSNHFSVIYDHCTFENSNGYVNNLNEHQGEISAKEETIKVLKEEVKRLREQNDNLLEKIKLR